MKGSGRRHDMNSACIIKTKGEHADWLVLRYTLRDDSPICELDSYTFGSTLGGESGEGHSLYWFSHLFAYNFANSARADDGLWTGGSLKGSLGGGRC